jgi:hypothetical protein
MKFRNPIYLAFSLLLTGYVAAANYYGWSPVGSLKFGSGPRGYSATAHK